MTNVMNQKMTPMYHKSIKPIIERNKDSIIPTQSNRHPKPNYRSCDNIEKSINWDKCTSPTWAKELKWKVMTGAVYPACKKNNCNV